MESLTVSPTTMGLVVLVALVAGGLLGWVMATLRERVRTAAAESRAAAAVERRDQLEGEVY